MNKEIKIKLVISSLVVVLALAFAGACSKGEKQKKDEIEKNADAAQEQAQARIKELELEIDKVVKENAKLTDENYKLANAGLPDIDADSVTYKLPANLDGNGDGSIDVKDLEKLKE